MRAFLSDVWDFIQAWAVLLTLPVWLPIGVVLVGLNPATFMRVTEGKGWSDVWAALADLARLARLRQVLHTAAVLALFALATLGAAVFASKARSWTIGLVTCLWLGTQLFGALVNVWAPKRAR
jgi:hypothetical protein